MVMSLIPFEVAAVLQAYFFHYWVLPLEVYLWKKMPEISDHFLEKSFGTDRQDLPPIGQTSHFQTLQAEHDIVVDTSSRHSMTVIPIVDLNGNHIPGGKLTFYSRWPCDLEERNLEEERDLEDEL